MMPMWLSLPGCPVSLELRRCGLVPPFRDFLHPVAMLTPSALQVLPTAGRTNNGLSSGSYPPATPPALLVPGTLTLRGQISRGDFFFPSLVTKINTFAILTVKRASHMPSWVYLGVGSCFPSVVEEGVSPQVMQRTVSLQS